ncbi:hypothetical protein [Longitalea luteola]|uniref:hypothetical protein n=1 Tax=Longitalea luteola TaxID=2812563 RepID=UPI001A979342|nr:hypothetical protein [Longitalea luteola]
MVKKKSSFFIALICPLLTCGHPARVNDCNKVKYGTFYFYPPKTNDEFVIIRDKHLQREIDYKTKDTTFWQLKWKNDCEFSLRFIRQSGPISDDEKAFYNAHVSVVQIAKVSKEYYVFKGGLDSIESRNAVSDTIWFKPRIK